MTSIQLPPKPATYHRAPTECAAELLRGFTRESRRVIVCKGQVDMADLVLAGLAITGRAMVTIATWETDMDRVLPMLAAAREQGLVRGDVRLMLPNGSSAADGRDMDGVAVVYAANHAKVATLRNERWNLVIHGSPNIAQKGVAEQVEIEDSPEICDAFGAFFAAPKAKARYPRAEAMDMARAALAVLPAGGRAWGISNGYSLIHLLRAAIERVGPGATVETFSWACGGDEAAELASMRDSGEVAELRVLVCPWFFQLEDRRRRSRPKATDVAAVLGSSLRGFLTHGRFFAVRGTSRSVTVHTSANLNRNAHTEQWSASEDVADVTFWSSFHADAWASASGPRSSVAQQHAAERAAFGVSEPLSFAPGVFPAGGAVVRVGGELGSDRGHGILHGVLHASAYHEPGLDIDRYAADPPLAWG